MAVVSQVATVHARDIESTVKPPLILSQALSRVLQDSPELSSYSYKLRSAEARTVQASLRPNPELSLVAENIAGDNEFTGNDSSETTIALSQEIELGGKRHYRKEVARLDADNLRRNYDFVRFDVLSKAANHYLDVARAQQVLVLAQQSEGWAETAERAAQDRFEAGSASRTELSQARIELMNANLTLTEAQSNVEMVRRELAGQWGKKQVDFGEVQVDIFNFTNKINSFSEMSERLDQSPYLQRYIAMDRLRQAELKLEIAQGRKNVNVSLGVRQFEATGDQALIFELSMPLGISDRNQGKIEVARVNLERLGAERQASAILLDNKLYRLYKVLQQAQRRVELLQSKALPEAEQALAQIDQGYRGGRFSYLQLVETHRQRLSVERNIIDTAIEYHRTLFMLEELFGESLTDESLSLMSYDLNEPNLPEDVKQ